MKSSKLLLLVLAAGIAVLLLASILLSRRGELPASADSAAAHDVREMQDAAAAVDPTQAAEDRARTALASGSTAAPEAQPSEAPEASILHGRVLDEDGRPVPHTLVELWQANAGGRYRHFNDNHPAPIDPHFTGSGRTMTDAEGRYRFVTIKPGAYPWRNHHNAWRPAHIHFSLFGPSFLSRVVTQMYFPNDPLFPYDPMFQSIPDPRARERLISAFSLDLTEPEWALAYTFDIILRGPNSTPFEQRT